MQLIYLQPSLLSNSRKKSRLLSTAFGMFILMALTAVSWVMLPPALLAHLPLKALLLTLGGLSAGWLIFVFPLELRKNRNRRNHLKSLARNYGREDLLA